MKIKQITLQAKSGGNTANHYSALHQVYGDKFES